MERGRSLSELGRTMTWSDLRAFVEHLPMTSHFWRKEEPEQAKLIAWVEGLATPHVAVVGELYDLVERHVFPTVGAEPILQRMQQRALDSLRQKAGEAKPAEPAKPVRRRKSAAEIRAQLERAHH